MTLQHMKHMNFLYTHVYTCILIHPWMCIYRSSSYTYMYTDTNTLHTCIINIHRTCTVARMVPVVPTSLIMGNCTVVTALPESSCTSTRDVEKLTKP